MITPKDIALKSMSPAKRESASKDWFAHYVGRPISYVLTVPFLYTKISPNAISLFSLLPIVGCFLLFSFAQTTFVAFWAWFCQFTWSMLDGIDGNIARYKGITSPLGAVYDAMGGYAAMVVTFFGPGIAAAHMSGIFNSLFPVNSEIYIILGALSGIFVIFPRLIMHKKISTFGSAGVVDNVNNRSQYGIITLLVFNFTSITGFAQVILLVAIFFHMLDIFTIGYFICNTVIMLVSIKSVLSKGD